MMTEDGVPSVNPKLDAIGEMLKTIHDLDERNKALEKQLTKAKEIIKDFLLMAEVEHLKDRYETVDEAEQFLSEVET